MMKQAQFEMGGDSEVESEEEDEDSDGSDIPIEK